MKTYSEYKNSKIEWIGKIPKHWSIKKIKQASRKIGSGGTPDSKIERYYINGTTFWLTSGDLNDGYITQIPTKITPEALEHSSAKIFPKNTFVIAMYGATVGKIGILSFDASTNQACCCILPNEKILQLKFLFYYYKSYKPVLLSLCQGGGQPNISQKIIKNSSVPIPPKDEQIAIANFLDERTSKIDKVIQNKKRQIELLEENEEISIKEAVTKGSNKNNNLTKSGIEYIENVPKDWKIKKIQYTTYVKGRIGWQGLTSEEYLDEGEYHLVTGTDFFEDTINWETCHYIEKERYDEDPYIQLKKNDILITKDGTIGKIAFVSNVPKPTTLNTGVFVIRPENNTYLPKFMFLILKSKIFTSYIEYIKTGSTISHLYQKKFVLFYYPLPSIKEQKEIIEYLDRIRETKLMSEKKLTEEISKLEEYRQILINEAVTGKIRVTA